MSFENAPIEILSNGFSFLDILRACFVVAVVEEP